MRIDIIVKLWNIKSSCTCALIKVVIAKHTLCSNFALFSSLKGYLFENFYHVFVQVRAPYILTCHCLTTSFRPSEVKLRMFIARRQKSVGKRVHYRTEQNRTLHGLLNCEICGLD